MDGFTARVVGWLFVAAAAMLWLGWVLLPARPGMYFTPGDFAAIKRRFRPWIWLYRVHLFGHLATVMAFVALASTVGGDSRVLVWPGVAVLAGGALVAALATAFYYHFGAWGAAGTAGQPPESLAAHVESLRVPTEYVTCLTRFGRVFFGLGQLVLAAGLLYAGLLPLWLTAAAALLGVAAIAVTMAFPDHLDYYLPIFHLNVAWMLAAGVTAVRAGALP